MGGRKLGPVQTFWRRVAVEDPAGNPIELFEPRIEEARLSPQGEGGG